MHDFQDMISFPECIAGKEAIARNMSFSVPAEDKCFHFSCGRARRDDVSLLFLPADTCQSQSAILKQYLLLIIQLPVNHLRLCFSCESKRTSSRIWALQPPCVLTPKSLQQTPTTAALLGRSAIPVSNCWQRSLCSPPFRQVHLACHSVF